MSKDIYQKHIEVKRIEKASVYMPGTRVLYGEVDGEQFSIVVNERDLPVGTDPGFTETPNLIAWDNKFFLNWEPPTGVPDAYNITIKDSNGDVVSEIEGLQDTEIIIDGDQAQFASHDNEYTFELEAIIYGDPYDANTVSGYSRDKVPKNLKEIGTTADTAELEWDDVATSFKNYKVYIQEVSSGDIIQKIAGIQSSNVKVFGLEDNTDYNAWVTAISAQGIFESGKSNQVTFTATNIPDAPANFTANVIDPEPDSPTNFKTTELPEPPSNFTTTVQ